MNKENIQKVIDLIKASPDENQNHEGVMFDMEYFLQVHHKNGHPCGTTACIGGFAAIAANALDLEQIIHVSGEQTSYYFHHTESIHQTAEEFLDINRSQSDDLFFAPYLDEITKEDAIWTLENLIKTGEVVWRHVDE